jgi:hypothetical protein
VVMCHQKYWYCLYAWQSVCQTHQPGGSLTRSHADAQAGSGARALPECTSPDVDGEQDWTSVLYFS